MRFRHILSFIALCLFFSAQANNFALKTVVIDAGHGGKDPGAIGPGKNYEKDVALAVALKLGAYIEENMPDVKVVYTRKTDVFVELHERAAIANKAKADLFIAIHCNSSPNSDFYGTSSYILGLHRTEANLEVAKRENAVILLEEDRDKNYEFNPNTPEGHIIMSMKQNAFLEQSIDFAAKIENQLENYARRKSMGVKQAGFYVLYKTAMPSLLAEIGFISNPEEERYLTSARGQDQIAAGLFNAFKDYKAEMEGVELTGKPIASEEIMKKPEPVKKEEPKKEETPAVAKPTVAETAPVVVKKEEPVVKKVEPTVKKEEPVVKKEEPIVVPPPVVKEEVPAPQLVKETISPTASVESDVIKLYDGNVIKRPVPGAGGGGKTTASIDLAPVITNSETLTVKETRPVKTEPAVKTTTAKESSPTSKEATTTVKETPAVLKENKPTPSVVKESKPAPVATTKAETKTPVVIKEESKSVIPSPVPEVNSNRHPSVPVIAEESGVVFRIQLFALKGPLKDYDKFIRLFKSMNAEELNNGMTRYYAANATSYSEAKRFHTVAVSNGYKDAYIVGFKDGKRMSFDEMKEYEGK